MSEYRKEQDQIKIEKTKKILEILPDYCKHYFTGRSTVISTGTELAYAKDLLLFYKFLSELYHKEIKEINLDDINNLKGTDIESFLSYIKSYKDGEGNIINNGEASVKRKYSCLKTFFAYYFRNDFIENNPMLKIETPKIHRKEIIRLDDDETEELLDAALLGIKTSKVGTAYAKINGLRNYTIMRLLANTGLRVSECVGLDINDIDLDKQELRLIRKGGNFDLVYFNNSTKNALATYLEERKEIKNIIKGSEKALFLSSRKTRLSVRSIENIVKEHAQTVTLKHITPHKFRSSFASKLYEETDGNAILVSKALNHSSIATGERYYIDASKQKLKLKDIEL